MNLAEAAMAAAITLSVVGVSYATLNTEATTRSAHTVADRATCRAVDAGILAYLADRETTPTSVADLGSYVDGDLHAYRIERGRAAGPGCSVA